MPGQTMGFAGLLEAVPDALVGVNRSGVIQFVNHHAESLFGYDRDDLVGAPLETLVPESFRQVHVVHREGYCSAPRTRPMGADLLLSGRRADGSAFPVDISLSCSDPGDAMLVVAAVRDMTEHRKADQERERGARLAAVVESSGEAIISATLEAVITSWNPAAERLYGYSSQEIIGKPSGSLAANDPAEPTKALDEVRAGRTLSYDTVGVRKDGTVFPASLTVSPICDADGTVIGSSTISRDVTEQRKAFEAAQTMAAVVEFSGEAIMTSTLDGIITSWNPAAERLYGYSSQEIVGRAGRALSPADRTHDLDNVLTLIGAGGSVSGGRGESHTPAPTDPGVRVSPHRALVILILRNRRTMPTGRKASGTGGLSAASTPWPSGTPAAVDTSCGANASSSH